MMVRRKASRERPRAFAWAARFAPASGGSSSVIVMVASFNIVPLRQWRGKYRLAKRPEPVLECVENGFRGNHTGPLTGDRSLFLMNRQIWTRSSAASGARI